MSAPPLAGVRIAVTRPAGQAEELAQPLRSAGAEVLVAPLIRLAPLASSSAVADAAGYDWLVLTSVNGVDQFVAAYESSGREISQLAAHKVACVGPATAAAATAHGLRVALVPVDFTGEAIADALAVHDDLRNKRVLLARAGGARLALPEKLRAMGALVDDVELYQSELDQAGAALLQNAFNAGGIDVVTFTSGSAIRYFREEIGSTGSARVAVIGPVTAEAADAAGISVDIQATPHSIAGLVNSIVQYFAGSEGA